MSFRNPFKASFLHLVLTFDHSKCDHTRQYIANEGGGYQQQRDEHPVGNKRVVSR